MAKLGDSWGTEDELLHPRGKDGRFRSKAGVGMITAVAKRILALLARIDYREFGSDQQASQYLFSSYKDWPEADKRRLLADLHDTQVQLQAGRMDASTKKFVDMMDAQLQPAHDDLILHRTMGPEAFGITPEMMDAEDGGVWDLPGKVISSKGYTPSRIGTNKEAGPGVGPIHMAIVAPKGTKIAPTRNGPNDRGVMMDRDLPIRITKVDRDGRGGFHITAIVDTEGGGEEAHPLRGTERETGATPEMREARATARGMSPAGRQQEREEERETARVAEFERRRGEGTLAPPPPGPTDTGPGGPPPRVEPIHSESVGGGAPSAPGEAPAPAVPEEPVRTVDFRAAFDEAGIGAPSDGPRRRQFNKAYEGITSGKRRPEDALRELEADIAVNDRALIQAKADGVSDKDREFEQDIRIQKQLADLIAEQHGLERGKREEERPKPTLSKQDIAEEDIVARAQRVRPGEPSEKPLLEKAAQLQRQKEIQTGRRHMTVTQARHTTALEAIAKDPIKGDDGKVYRRIASGVEGGQMTVPQARHAAREEAKRYRSEAGIANTKAENASGDRARGFRRERDENQAMADRYEKLRADLLDSQSPQATDKYVNPPEPKPFKAPAKKAAPAKVVPTPTGELPLTSARTKDYLVGIAKKEGVDPVGTKADLLERIRAKREGREIPVRKAVAKKAAPPKPAKEPGDIDQMTKAELLADPRAADAKQSWTKDRIKAHIRGETPAPVKRAPAKKAAPAVSPERAKLREEGLDGTNAELEIIANNEGVPRRGRPKNKAGLIEAIRARRAEKASPRPMGIFSDNPEIRARAAAEIERQQVLGPEGPPTIPVRGGGAVNTETGEFIPPSRDLSSEELITIRDLSARGRFTENGWVQRSNLPPGRAQHLDALAEKGWVDRDGDFFRISPMSAGARGRTPQGGVLEGDVLPAQRPLPSRISLTQVNRGAILEGYSDPDNPSGFTRVPEDGTADPGRIFRVRVQRQEMVDKNGEPTKAIFQATHRRVIGHDVDTGKRVQSDVVPAGSYWSWEMNPDTDTSPDIEGEAVETPERRAISQPPIVDTPAAQKPIQVPDRKQSFDEAWDAKGFEAPQGSANRSLQEIRDDISTGRITPDEGIRRLETEIELNGSEMVSIDRALRSTVPDGRGGQRNLTPEEEAKLKAQRFDLGRSIRAQVDASKFLRGHFKKEPDVTPDEVKVALVESDSPEARSLGERMRDMSPAEVTDLKRQIKDQENLDIEGETGEEVFDNALKAIIKRELAEREKKKEARLAPAPRAPDKAKPNLEGSKYQRIDARALAEGLDLRDPQDVKMLDRIQAMLDGDDDSIGKNPTPAAIGRYLEGWNEGPAGPRGGSALTPHIGADSEEVRARTELESKRGDEWKKLADRLGNTRRQRAQDRAPDVEPKVTREEKKGLAGTSELTGIPQEDLEKAALRKKQAEAPPKQSAQQVAETLKTMGSRDEARTLLQGRTKAELVDILKAQGVPGPRKGSKATKADITTDIVELEGARLDGNALRNLRRGGGIEPGEPRYDIPKAGSLTRQDLMESDLETLKRIEDDMGIKRHSLNKEDRVNAIIEKAGGPRPEPEPPTPTPGGKSAREIEVNNRVKAAYRKLRPDSGSNDPDFLGIADVRDELSDIPRAEQDAALIRLLDTEGRGDRPNYRIIPVANTKALRPRDREAALTLPGTDRPLHAISFRDPSPERGPEPPTPGGGTRYPATGPDLTGERGLSTDEAVRNVQIENRIRAAYERALAKKPNQENRWVSLAELRDELGEGINRNELDAAMLRMGTRDRGVSVVPEDVQRSLTQADRDAAINQGGRSLHNIRMEDTSLRPLPGSEPPTPTPIGPEAPAKVLPFRRRSETMEGLSRLLNSDEPANDKRDALNLLAKSALLELAQRRGIEDAGDLTKPEIIDRLMGGPAPRAPRTPTPEKKMPSLATVTPIRREGIDEDVSLRGDPEGDNSIMHGDSATMELAQAYAKKNRNGTANRLMELRRSTSTMRGEDSKDLDGPQKLVDELKRLRDDETDAQLKAKLDEAIKELDWPKTPVPELPEGTPPALRKLVEDLNKIPVARAPKGSRLHGHTTQEDSPVDRLAAVYRDIKDKKGQVSGGQTEREIEDILRTYHESIDGAYRMWGLSTRAETDNDLRRQLTVWIRELRQGG